MRKFINKSIVDVTMDKRGQGMSISTIILLILGVIVLAILAIGFSVGWQKINPFVGGNNIQTVQTQCTAYCASGDSYSYCTKGLTLKTDSATYKNVTCDFMSSQLDIQIPTLKIDTCPSISCPSVVVIDNSKGTITNVADLQKQCSASGNAGQTLETLVKNDLISVSCPVSTSTK